VGTHRGELGDLVEAALEVLGSLLDAIHLDVAAKALALELLLELGTHLGLLEGELLLDVLVSLNFKLGVHLSLDALPIFLDAELLVIFELLEFQLLLEFVLRSFLLLDELLGLADLHRNLVFFGGAAEAHVSPSVTGNQGVCDLLQEGVHLDLLGRN